ncbi:Mu transposase C-terminal domain-containing protein [Methylobacterium sp. 10]|uniref:Mu transposase C-terminal domain-containing protein n=1 Tax=Methylobacterium sp. 10 TaxID=1101191 RepID=UPI00048329C9|nr:Mu transposase C-terminal domain-containing protein [Methylobacterium sp. 10]
MTLHHNHHSVVAPGAPGPRWDFAKGDLVSIGAPLGHTLRRLVYERAIPGTSADSVHGVTQRQLVFHEIPSGSIVMLTDQQIAFLAMEGEFRLDVIDESTGQRRGPLPTNLDLTETERAYVERHWPYIEALIAQGGHLKINRQKLDPIVAEVNARSSGKPISTSTVIRLHKLWLEHGGRLGRAAIIPKRGRGNRIRPWPDVMMQELKNTIPRVLKLPKGGAEDVLSLMHAWADETYPNTNFKLPSLRTIQREMRKIDAWTKDAWRKGEGYANRKHASYYETIRPDLPLEDVETDHTTFDLPIIDDESDLVFGRPDVIAFRCRRTGYCLGYGIGWEAPSYTSFLEGVRHAMYPKDLSAFPNLKHDWPAYGRWKRLFVDNALHFLGVNIANAAAELKFETAELPPATPWMKGAEERLLGILNRKVAHIMPGTTLSNPVERKDHEEALLKPALTLREFEAFLVAYIVDDYHQRPHEGLGPLRTMKDIPARIWNAEIGAVKIQQLPDPDTFTALAGDIDERTIQQYGIEWDRITYQSEALFAIRAHGEHKKGRRPHRGSKYRVTRDPQNLGMIWVLDPYQQQRIPVPAVRQDYAAGLTLHQHRVIQAQHTRMVGQFTDIDGLLRTRAEMVKAVEALREERVKLDIARKMARFLNGQASKRVRSTVQTKIESAVVSSTPLDIENPIGVVQAETRSKRATQSNRRRRAADPERVSSMQMSTDGIPKASERPTFREPIIVNDDPDQAPDIDSLKERHQGWEDI